MEEPSILKCWIYKQPRSSKRLHKQWLVLSQEALSIYKRPDDPSHVLKVPIDTILDVEKKDCQLVNDLSGFCVKTHAQDLTFFVEQSITEDQIQSFLLNVNSTVNREEESKAIDLLRDKFAQIKQILDQREQELLFLYEELHQSLNAEATNQLLRVDQALNNQEIAYRDFQTEISQQSSLSLKGKLTSFDMPSLMNTQVPLSINSHHLPQLLSKNIRIDSVDPNQMSVSRSTITRALKWCYPGDKIDALSFTVSSNVLLTGIGICIPYKSNGFLTVKKFMVLSGRSVDDKPVYIHKLTDTVKHSEDSSVHQVKLTSPLSLRKDQEYTAYFEIEGSPSYKCVDCLSECVSNSVRWKFLNTLFSDAYHSNRTDAICGPIARFYFTPIN